MPNPIVRLRDAVWGGRGDVGKRATDVPEELWTGNQYGQVTDPDSAITPFNPAQSQLLARLHGSVLAEHGIYPMLPERRQAWLWSNHEVDPSGRLTPRDYQAVILSSLVLDGECWIRKSGGGKFEPLPAPNNFSYNSAKKDWDELRWDELQVVEGFTLTPDQVIHLVIPRLALQRRGFRLPQDTQHVMRKSGLLALAAINAETLFRALSVRLKSSGQIRTGSGNAQQTLQRRLTLGLRQLMPINLSGDDSVETLSGASPPTDPMRAQEYIAGHVGGALGLSRIMLTGDAAQSNFSASRFSIEMDYDALGVMRRKIVQATQPVWEAFRALHPAEDLPEVWELEWRYPPKPVLDPVKRASELKILLDLKIITTEEARAEAGYPPRDPADMPDEMPPEPEEPPPDEPPEEDM